MSETTDRIIDRRELLALVPYSHSQIARMEKTGDFPRRLQLSRGRVGYSFHEVLRWIETRKASRQDATSNAPSIDAASPVDVPPAIDFEEAGRFLRILDPHADRYSFWCFYDVAEIAPKEPHLAAMLHVSLEDGAGLLTDDSRRGASISVVINETDGEDRRYENIVRIRAVFADFEGGVPEHFPLPPSLVVQWSPRNFYSCWLVDGLSFEEFDAVVARLTQDYGSKAKGRNRALRLPGAWYRKGAPFRVRIVESGGIRYTRDEILKAFPPLPQRESPEEEIQERVYFILRSCDCADEGRHSAAVAAQ